MNFKNIKIGVILSGLILGLGIGMNVNAEEELITNGGFESGSANWNPYGNFYADSRFTNAYNGSGYAYLSNLDGTSGNSLVGWIYQNVTIPSNITSATLSFYYNITSQEIGSSSDILNVTIQNSTGGHLGNVVLLSSLDKALSAGNPYYTERIFDLTSYKGQTIRVNFLATTNSGLPTTFRLDDVSLIVNAPSPSVPTFGNNALSNETPICDHNVYDAPAVRLNWDPADGATSYHVYRNGSLYENVASDLTFYNSANVTAGQTYTYYIQARNAHGSTNSNTVTVYVESDICDSSPSPSVPTFGNNALSNETPICDHNVYDAPAVRLNWDPADGATSYHVYRNGSLYENVASDLTFYNSANVTAGQTYTYYIQARNAHGSTNSNTVTVYVESDICDSSPSPYSDFEIDFSQVDYGNAMLNMQSVVNGDLFFDPPVSHEPTLRNNSNSNVNISIQQDDMGLGISNVKYSVRVGNTSPWIYYNPYETVNLTLDALQTNSINFGILVNNFSPWIENYQGILTVNGIEVSTQLSRANTDYFCGNGFLEEGEECDGSDFGGQSCGSFGFDSGSLSCSESCQIITSGCSVVDITLPVLEEIISIPTPTNDNTPSYMFDSSEDGNITYSDSCSSITIVASAGGNIITFNELANGTYNDCTITVTDVAGNASEPLSVSTFIIDTTKKTILSINDIEVFPDQSVTVPIMIDNSPGIHHIEIKINYDPDIVSVTDTTEGDFNDVFGVSASTDGWVIISGWGNNLTGNLKIADITLKAVGNVEDSSLLDLEVLNVFSRIVDEDIPVTINDGTFTILEKDTVLPQCSDGIDNDGDGLIDMDDSGCENEDDNDETDTTYDLPGDFELIEVSSYCDTQEPAGPAIQLKWSKSIGATSYELYRNKMLYTILSAEQLSFINNIGLIAGENYIYKVKAVNDVGSNITSEVEVNISSDICENSILPQCSDGIDNDGDGLVDMDDSKCDNSEDNDESGEKRYVMVKGDIIYSSGLMLASPIACEAEMFDHISLALEGDTNSQSYIKKLFAYLPWDYQEVIDYFLKLIDYKETIPSNLPLQIVPDDHGRTFITDENGMGWFYVTNILSPTMTGYVSESQFEEVEGDGSEPEFYVSVTNGNSIITNKTTFDEKTARLYDIYRKYEGNTILLENDEKEVVKQFQCEYFIDVCGNIEAGYGVFGPGTKRIMYERIGALKIVPKDWILSIEDVSCLSNPNDWCKVKEIGASAKDGILEGYVSSKYLKVISDADDANKTKKLFIGKEIISNDYTFVNNLDTYTEEDIKNLQILLRNEGYEIYPYRYMTGVFGDITEAALKLFQDRYKLVKDENNNDIICENNTNISNDCGKINQNTADKLNEIFRNEYDNKNTKNVIIEAVSHYGGDLNISGSLYDNADFVFFGQNKIFPTSLYLAMIAHEIGGTDYDNEWISFDYGHGVGQVTDCPGEFSNLKFSCCHKDEDYNSEYYSDKNYSTSYKLTKRNYLTYKLYTNTSQGIHANIKDGLGILKNKYDVANSSKYSYEAYTGCDYDISAEEMKMISTLFRYNGGWFKIWKVIYLYLSYKDESITSSGDYNLDEIINKIGNEHSDLINSYPGKEKVKYIISEANIYCPNMNVANLAECVADIKAADKIKGRLQGDPFYAKNVADYLKTDNSPFGDEFEDNKLANKLECANEGMIIVSIASPGELRVIDSQNHVTGVVNGEVVEDVSNSIYDKESGVITLLFPSNDYRYEVIGTDNGEYGLVLSSFKKDVTFSAENIPTTPGEVHQYAIDWQALSQGEKGVTIQIDEGGDGVFEETIISDATLEPPIADIGESYESTEGTEITFDASQSTDADGGIDLYKWDFDGDGNYDESSTSPTMTYIYGDDYSGEITLRVTDDEGLIDVTTADVQIDNVDPEIETFGDQTIEVFDEFIYENSFTDVGWLDTHDALIEWGDGVEEDISLIEENGELEASGKVIGSHVYDIPSVYTMILYITDDDGGIDASKSEITVEKRKTELSYIGELSGQYSDEIKFQAILTDKLGGIKGKTINFDLGGQFVSAVTNSGGIAETEITLNEIPGDYEIETSFQEDEFYLSSSNPTDFEIMKDNTLLSIPNGEIVYSDDATIQVTLHDDENEFLLNQVDFQKTVYLEYLNGTEWKFITKDALYSTDNTDDTLDLCFQIPDNFDEIAGNYDLRARFLGDSYYNETTSEMGNLGALKEDTILSDSSATVTYSDSSTLEITFQDNDGETLFHQSDEPKIVYLEVLNGTEWKILSEDLLDSVDNSDKTLTFTFEIQEDSAVDLSAGDYELRARFDGDSRYNSTVAIGTLAIVKEEVVITVEDQEGYFGETVLLEATILDDDGEKLYHDPNKVTFSVGGNVVGEDEIDKNGKAKISWLVDYIPTDPNESYPIEVSFSENEYYLSSEGQGEFNLKSAKQLKEDTLAKLKTITTDNKQAQKEIDKAVEDIENSLASELWIGISRLDQQQGHKVFDREKQAVKSLLKIIEEKGKHIDPEIIAELQDIINDLAKVDVLLAKAAIYDAENIEADDTDLQKKIDDEINKAKESLEKALQESADDNPSKAIDYLKKAWKSAQLAIDFFLDKTNKWKNAFKNAT